MPLKVGLTSLGCAKNLVDSEVILGFLREGGLEVCEDLNEAEAIIVNTCAFIAEAEEESRGVIAELQALKGAGRIARLLVAGCLPSRRGGRLAAEFPGVDRFVSVSEIPRIAEIVRRVARGGDATPAGRLPLREGGGNGFLYDHRSPRYPLTPAHYAYLKIAEGCDNRCAYCVIPRVRGPLRSRELGSVVEEARGLAGRGVRELNLVAQDTAGYGLDRDGGPRLPELIRSLGRLEGVSWIRTLYCHPAHITPALLEAIAEEPKACRALDIPLQHADDAILKAMRRGVTAADAESLIAAARGTIPGVAIRTTFIVGYPGEGEGEFRRLLDFVARARFERLGAFVYSPEDGTAAALDPRRVPEEEARERLDRLMALQAGIVRELQEGLAGSAARVMVDEVLREGPFRLKGRTEGDAPEVDGDVYLRGDCGGAAPGDIVEARITGAEAYDLTGELACPEAPAKKPGASRRSAGAEAGSGGGR